MRAEDEIPDTRSSDDDSGLAVNDVEDDSSETMSEADDIFENMSEGDISATSSEDDESMIEDNDTENATLERYNEFLQRLKEHQDYLMDDDNWIEDELEDDLEHIQNLFIDFFYDILKEETDIYESIRSTRELLQCCSALAEAMKECCTDLYNSSSDASNISCLIDYNEVCFKTEVREAKLNEAQLSALKTHIERANKKLTKIHVRARDDFLRKLPKLIDIFRDLASMAYSIVGDYSEPELYVHQICQDFAPKIAKICKKPYKTSSSSVLYHDVDYFKRIL